MYHEDLRDLSSREREALRAYAGAHARYAGAAVNFFPTDSRYVSAPPDVDAQREAVQRLLDAHRELSALAPGGVPGRDGVGYGELLGLFRDRDLGSRCVLSPSGPALPAQSLPSARQMLYALLDLDRYLFLTRGDPETGRGQDALFDLPRQATDAMSEEEIVGAHGDRNELYLRLDRVLNFVEDEAIEGGRSQRMWSLGYECGEETRTFLLCHTGEPHYVDGFVRGCAERLYEEGSVEEVEAVDSALSMWEDPAMSAEEKNALVVESLMADCVVALDEGEMWRM